MKISKTLILSLVVSAMIFIPCIIQAQSCQPPVVTASSPFICSGNTMTLTASGSIGSYYWYATLSSGVPLHVGTTFTTPSLISTTTYYVAAVSLWPFCFSARTPVTVTVNPVPPAPAVSVMPVVLCTGGTAVLTASAQGGTFEWFTALTGGTSIHIGSVFTTPPLPSSVTYYVQNTLNGCTGSRAAVPLTVNPIPDAPTASATPSVIYAGMTSNLTATAPGGNYMWYDAPWGGTLLHAGADYTTPALSATTTFYVQTTVAGCTGQRTDVTVGVITGGGSLWTANGLDIYRPSGNVGIGTSTPTEKLDVDGNAVISGRLKLGFSSLFLDGSGGSANNENHIWTTNDPGGDDNLYIQSNDDAASGHAPSQGNTVINANGSSGYVGIGVNAPDAKLHVGGGAVLFEGDVGGTPVLGPGTRMMWIPEKAAFRVGKVTGSEWDDNNISEYSIGMGLNALANGYPGNIAIGSLSKATGLHCLSLGNESESIDVASTAIGFKSKAHGSHSTAIGSTAHAIGNFSSAFGVNVTADAEGSIIIGNHHGAMLTNDIPYSLMVKFGNTPTLFANVSNVGIGTTDPKEKLHVNGKAVIGQQKITSGPHTDFMLAVDGKIISHSMVCTMDNWADDVFREGYELMSIEDVAKYIKEHKHLPGVPSEKEVIENGLDLGEINATLLRKIEELTLYLIELKKEKDRMNMELRILGAK